MNPYERRAPEPVQPRNVDLWSSAEVAQAFRVGVSSVKRWTDEGELKSVRTPGGHRRYRLPAIYEFARIRSLSTEHLPPLDERELEEPLPLPADVTLFDALMNGDTEAVRRLVTPKVDTLTRRATFFDRVVGEALHEIGDRWERGQLEVEQEHRASYLIAESLDRLRPRPASDGPVAALACPPGEQHEMPLKIVRLVLEWSGWRTEYAGAQLPWVSARSLVQRVSPALLAFTSRTSEPFESADFDRLVDFCNARGTTVVTGGEWARGGVSLDRGYLRFRSFRGFERWLRGFQTRRQVESRAS
jgi:methanogenic corrinoid protein MtbC1